MITVTVWRGEMYPAYRLADEEFKGGGDVEVDADQLARWRKVQAEWDAVQDEMTALLAANPSYFDGHYWHI